MNTEKKMGSFDEAWAMFDSKFDPFMYFFDWLETVFPGAATVESDFSLINREKDHEYRSWPTDLSLEGVLHSTRQFFDFYKMLSFSDAQI